jgi:hypothetical protein
MGVGSQLHVPATLVWETLFYIRSKVYIFVNKVFWKIFEPKQARQEE